MPWSTGDTGLVRPTRSARILLDRPIGRVKLYFFLTSEITIWPITVNQSINRSIRYHREPRAVFGGKLDQSAMVETVVLVACRGGLHDEEV